jgi:hypothetical protein
MCLMMMMMMREDFSMMSFLVSSWVLYIPSSLFETIGTGHKSQGVQRGQPRVSQEPHLIQTQRSKTSRTTQGRGGPDAGADRVDSACF